MSGIALVIIPGSEGLTKAAEHPAGLSPVRGNTKSKIPYESHEERMKLAKMAVARMQAPKPENESAHTDSGTVDHKGRVPGEKAPYDKYSKKVGGMGSEATNNFGRKSYIVKPSEIGSSSPENASAHQPKSVPKPKK